jgi:ferric-dicitrate binding protein FerR (iron transport regulator)
MTEYDKNIDFFKNLEADFKTSEEDLWAKIEEKTQKASKPKSIQLHWAKYAVAASLILLLGIGSFLRFYTVELVVDNGQQLSHELPDGSQIKLNAATVASYQPYWWNFKREIKLSGEAFFEVAKGEKFSVTSEEATTSVLGTSFNIFARDKEYQVYCKTGKVSVSSNKYDINYKLIPGDLAIIDNANMAGSKKSTDERDYLAWTFNKFSFTNAPLSAVFIEMERQYNIQIDFNPAIANYTFGAYFEKPETAVEAIDLICVQFQLNFEETKERKYKIY